MYKNNSIDAVLAMERERTGNYGNDDEYCEDDLEFMYGRDDDDRERDDW